MQIKQHDRSHMVELKDGSAWRIWPGDIPKTLQWLPTTEIDVADIEDEICSHALVDRSNGSRPWCRRPLQVRRDLHEEEITPQTRYIVVQHENEWLIKFREEEYGPYRS